MEYRKASLQDLERIWEKNIRNHPGNNLWVEFKKEAIKNYEGGRSATFVIDNDGDLIGEITVMISPKCKSVGGDKDLCNDETVHMDGFRVEKRFEGQGHISKLVKIGEEYARYLGKKYATIGVNADNARNIGIYLHFGYTKFIKLKKEKTGKVRKNVLYYKKEL